MAELTVRQAEAQLVELATVLADKENIILTALESGVPKARIHALTGLARSTIDRIIERSGDAQNV